MRRSRPVLRSLLSLAGLLATTWGAMALGYRLEWPLAGLGLLIAGWTLLGLGLVVALWRGHASMALAGYALAFAVLLAWWNSLQPSNDRDWSDDVARLTTGRSEGSQLHLRNVRNFDWHSDEDYTIAWENRDYDLDGLRSVDMLTSYWGMPAIAHVLVSFGFDDGRFLTFTVEIRKERGEAYSEIGGFFKQFELSILATDERDAIRVRSNIRGEDVYLYRVAMPQSTMRALLLSYVEQANALARRPRFYNTVTANCTTIVFDMMRKIVGGLPLDHRLLLTGYLPGYVRDVGGLQPGHTLEELRSRGRITDRALRAGDSKDFSTRIRLGVPGWE
ncbi:DUF4105 domain-containing protein [Azoarcus indigens]|uniref:Uncharacterized protein DUF4105 n=1 Tax=Azoarcus indigens TaxID=29545 RepID=A0A4R6DZU8_9RHOO|nr:DUF4105 domain-containing protein [Azoarcus indigens]NMG64694.1 DUF4105 domain-containing protein [Azoarcus indigens]TDN50921.1 uncharacterized protein DUF4105 [Azoarcus indigens]